MFYYFAGKAVILEQNFAVIDCGGVGYKLGITLNTYKKIGETGKNVQLFSHLAVREDAMELFGFYDENELKSFRQLISVSGVGPKAAMSILSELSPEQFAVAIVTSDTKALSRAQGVGPKLAQRIALELKDKIEKDSIEKSIGLTDSDLASFGKGNLNEAVSALCVLGYSKYEASKAVMKTELTDFDAVDVIIRQALRNLMK